jgi:outer membrane receptor protein involved in Fe transport
VFTLLYIADPRHEDAAREKGGEVNHLAYTTALCALAVASASAAAAETSPAPTGANNASSSQGSGGVSGVEEVVVTATRRNERLQDVPISVTAFSQAELTQKGIVGFEGLARETPGAVLNVASDNNARLTARGISTNGWGAGLQTTTTIYLDELPLTTIGNTVTLNPNLYDVERVEFLRGPQGTLFGSGSLSGALRILTHSPNLADFDASALVDVGHTSEGGGIRQRYNGMVNIPLIDNTLGLRVVGFHRNEDGYVDNIGTGQKNSNSLRDSGGRAVLLWQPADRLSLKLLGSYEDSDPNDSSLTNPKLGERKRLSTRDDLYTSRTQFYNATLDYRFDWADLTSSSTYAIQDGNFTVDLAGTTANLVPFYLDDVYDARTFVQETRLVSGTGSKFDWVLGGFYLHRDTEVVGVNQSTPEFLAAHGITGLPADARFNDFGTDTRQYELAGFGDLTYHFTDKLSLSGGARYGKYGATVDTYPGFTTQLYFVYALSGIRAPLPIRVNGASTAHFPSASRTSWKASLTYEPSHDLTTYVTVSTGYRTPVYNARAGFVNLADPTDLVIPPGAGSDDLTNYEIGLKGRWLGGRVTSNLAAYFIDWRNIQVQANRRSDAIQFTTNVGRAESKGLEAEITVTPATGLTFGLNGSWNEAKVTELSAQEAIISGAVKGSRLASPHLQGSFFGTYGYALGGTTTGFTSFQIQHVGSFPNGFPNTPGRTTLSPLYASTDSYTYVNLQTGIGFGKMTGTLYVENLGNSDAVVYVHPESFVDSRYSILRPRTFGVRLGYEF